MKDYYRILGVPRGADTGEIKRAYRRLAKIHHPDLTATPASADRFGEVTEAYEILSDPNRRRRYDRLTRRRGRGDLNKAAVQRAVVRLWLGGLTVLTGLVRDILEVGRCPECGGRGVIRFGRGAFAVERPCPACSRPRPGTDAEPGFRAR